MPSENGMLTTAAASEAAPPGTPRGPRLVRPCTVIVPVYSAFGEALACVESVLAHTHGSYRLLILDDGSPEGSFHDFLPEWIRRNPQLQIHRNAENLGLVKTCNLGLRMAGFDDVVLLNSDTKVTPRWLVKLQQAAYSRKSVGTVTPLSNNGSICSLPESLQTREMPAEYALDDLAGLIESVSAREYPVLPTCVRFCVYIKRSLLECIGGFDECFDQGYGEENDLSCRAQAAGFVDILDDATFIYHRGTTSFGEEAARLKSKHLKIVHHKHPRYFAALEEFTARNPLAAIHHRIYGAVLQRWLLRAEYSVLHILHNTPLRGRGKQLPGGTELHVADLIDKVPSAAHFSFSRVKNGYCLTAHIPGHEQKYYLGPEELDLQKLLDPAFFDVIHVHQTSRLSHGDVAESLLRHGRYVIALHDFWLCCPRFNLLTKDRRLCNQHECTASCGVERAEIEQLRATTARMLSGARAVLCFSNSTKHYFGNMLTGEFRWQLIEHGTFLAQCGRPIAERPEVFEEPSPQRPLKVAFLGMFAVQGALAAHKGAHLVQEIVTRKTLPSGIPVEWHLVGVNDGGIKLGRNVIGHGRYDRSELPRTLEDISPHLVGILSPWPETYCFTLDEALSCGIPVVSTPLGAPAERVHRDGSGWVLDQLDAAHFMNKLQELVDGWDEYCAVRRRIPALRLRRVEDAAAQYTQIYRGACHDRPPVDALQRLRVFQEFARQPSQLIPRVQMAAGTLINCSLSLLGRWKVRAMVRAVAVRLIPRPFQDRIRELRLLPTPSSGTRSPLQAPSAGPLSQTSRRQTA